MIHMAQLPLELAIVEWSSLSGSRLPHVADDARSNLLEKTSAPRSLSESLSSSSGGQSAKVKTTFSSSASGQTPAIIGGQVSILQQLIDKIKVQNQSVAGVLRGCRVKSYDEKELVIETGFKFHKERLDEPKARDMIRIAVSEISGKEIKVLVMLKMPA